MEWHSTAKALIDAALQENEFVVKGVSHFRNKDKVKQLGARWVDKTWAAKSEEALLALADSGVWHPVGLPMEANVAIVAIINKMRLDREAAETALRKVRAGPTEEEKKASKLKEFGQPHDEPACVEKLAALGVTPEITLSSGEMAWLGPRSGISNAERLLRGLRFNLVTVEDLLAGTASDPLTGKQGRAGVGAKRGFGAAGRTLGRKRAKKPAAAQEQPSSEAAAASQAATSESEVEVAKVVVQRKYTAKCGECGSVVDSRNQFGLECECVPLRVWRACHACAVPFEVARTGVFVCSTCA